MEEPFLSAIECTWG